MKIVMVGAVLAVLLPLSAHAQRGNSSSAPPIVPNPGDLLYMSPSGVLTNLAYAPRTAWTPTITAATPGDLSVTYTQQVGYYSRIGSRVTADFTVSCTPTFTTAAGTLQVGTLPFVAAGMINFAGILSNPITSFPWTAATYTMIQPVIVPGSTKIAIYGYKTAAGTQTLLITNLTSGSAFSISGTVSYDTTTSQ